MDDWLVDAIRNERVHDIAAFCDDCPFYIASRLYPAFRLANEGRISDLQICTYIYDYHPFHRGLFGPFIGAIRKRNSRKRSIILLDLF